MAVLLYKKGNATVAKGVECDFIRVSIKSIAHYLANGYVSDPLELIEDKEDAVQLQEEAEGSTEEAATEEAEPVVTKEQADTNKSGKLSTEEVRQAAKKAKISGWDKKRIKTLKAELGWQD